MGVHQAGDDEPRRAAHRALSRKSRRAGIPAGQSRGRRDLHRPADERRQSRAPARLPQQATTRRGLGKLALDDQLEAPDRGCPQDSTGLPGSCSEIRVGIEAIKDRNYLLRSLVTDQVDRTFALQLWKLLGLDTHTSGATAEIIDSAL